MNTMQTWLAAAFLGAATTVSMAAAAPAFNGTWVGVVNLPNGMKLPFIAHLKQTGDAVSGVLDGINGAPDVMIENGMVRGDTLTFTGTRVINQQNVTFRYTVTHTRAGGLDFKIARSDGSGGAPLESITRRLSVLP